MTRTSRRSGARDESTRWRMIALAPIIVIALVGAGLTAPRLGRLSDALAAHGGDRVTCVGGRIVNFLRPRSPQDMLCLQLAFTSPNAARVFETWKVHTDPAVTDVQARDEKIAVARQCILVDWGLILSYTVGLAAFGLVLMWLLRYERHTFAPVLFCCPIIAGLLDGAENLAILEMLANPEHPPAVAAALGGAASSLKWVLLLVVVPLAIVWAIVKLPRRARASQQIVEDFPAVLAAERDYITERRRIAGLDDPGGTGDRPGPVGLSLSGGGIRSATFNLGVLQALARLDILRHVDYLSTVSGGGYIGSCFSSLLSHRKDALEAPDSRQFGPGDDAHFTTDVARFPFNPDAAEQATLRHFNGRDQLRHLRTHGDFLTVRRTLLSRDVLRAVGHALGSTFYHVLVAMLFLVAVAGLYLAVVEAMIGDLKVHVAPLLASPASYARALFDAGDLGYGPFGWAVIFGIISSVIGLGLGFVTYRVPARWIDSGGQSEEESRGYLALWILFWCNFATASAVSWYWISGSEPRLAFLCLPLGVYVGGQLTTLVIHPLVAIPSFVGRDVRSRFAGAQGLFTYFDVISLVVVTFPYVIVWLLLWEPGGKSALAWALSLVGARLIAAGTGQKSAGSASGMIARLRKLAPGLRNALLSVIAVVLVVGGVLLLCVWMLELGPEGNDHLVRFPLAVGLTAAALFTLLGVALDFNKLSLHYFYRDRLAETYLQTFATAPGGDRVEVQRRDDSEMPLTELHGRWRHSGHAASVCVTSAPYHLIMTALNLTASRDMTRRDRKSDYFVFSKLYCGSETTGYMKTEKYRSGETRLARAMSISGAAASSAVGAQTFLAQSFALTLLGVRLGQWMENPRYLDGRRANRNEGGVFWPFYLLREMIGSTDASRRLVNLSDGGHTGDNVGICPLLKRRCAVIIACDAEADPHSAFGSLTEALRQIYVDENVRVEIDLDQIKPDAATRRSARHWAVGKIYYPPVYDQDRGVVRPEEPGYLIVLKSSFVGGAEDSEPLKNYRLEHPEFPHESTVDQFFDDDQFESYRELGALVAGAPWPQSRR